MARGVSLEKRIKVIEDSYKKPIKEILKEIHFNKKYIASEIRDEFNKIFSENGIAVWGSNQSVWGLFKRLNIQMLTIDENPRAKQKQKEAARGFCEANSERFRENIIKMNKDPKMIKKQNDRKDKEKYRKRMKEMNKDPDIMKKQQEGVQKYRDDNKEEFLEHIRKINENLAGTRERTKPEIKVKELLDNLGVKYGEQVFLNFKGENGRISVQPDFKIGNNKVIEVQGDYFHVNPKKFDLRKLTKTQIKTIHRDQIKHSIYMENGFKVLYIWEDDIKNRIEIVKQEILNFIR